MKRPSLLAPASLAFLLLLSVVSVRPVWAQATLENPQPNSSQSGIGVISGWACDANRIEIIFNETDIWQAGYGTRRTDTQGVCGDTDNGFGLLFNWNLLGDGIHTVQALADGVEFGRATVTVSTFGQEFLRDSSEEVDLTDFPQTGTNAVLRWQETLQNFVITDGSMGGGGGTSGSPPHVLENPQPGSFQSGVGVISGWVCEASLIEIIFNGNETDKWQAGYGTRRTDTQGVCGDTNNGFGLLFNWNLLGDGSHTVRALADGVEFARATVTVTTLGQEFLRGISGEVTLPDFPQDGVDVELRWQEAQQNFVIISAAPTRRQVSFRPTVNIPTGVTSVQAGNVSVTSLSSSTAKVQASPAPTLLLGEDADGTVLLSIADMDGGLLGESPGRVEASIDSTAVTLVALAAGYRIPDIDQSVVNQITTHAHYPALLAAMTTALAADKNFLDRIFDYPQVVSLIRQVATFRTGTRQAAQQMYQTLSAQHDAVLPDGIVKNDFWCTPWGWPCSPWAKHEPWQWFGEAKGVTHFYPDSYLDVVVGLLTRGLSLSVTGYAGILKEATSQPFLARSNSAPRFHATANPTFADYAMELYSGDEYIDWYYTPRNSTVGSKLHNSGAAQRLLIPTGAGKLLNPEIDRVHFKRYRLSSGSKQAKALSFLNGFKAVVAAVNLFSELSAVVKWLDGLPGDGETVLYLAECVVDNSISRHSISRHIPEDTSGDTVPPMLAFIRTTANAWIDQLLRCPIADLPALLTDQVIRSYLEAAGLLTPYGWAKLAFDATNETVPVFTSYLAPSAGSAEYYIQWEKDTAGNPYIAQVSKDPPPSTSTPDLVVASPVVSVNSLTPGQAFTLSATVRNQGAEASPSTTLRYYRSSDADITRQDTEVDTDSVSGINPSNTRTASANLTAPSTAGTYYYGACVDSVTGEADTSNNCSSGFRVTVEDDSSTTDDHGNTRSDAASLSVDGSRSGQIEVGNDIDYFRVQVSGAGELTVYTTGGLDTMGRLENSSGISLEEDDDRGSGNNFRIARTVAAGTYYVKVESYSSNTGSYTLHASFSAATTPQVSITDASATEGNSLTFTVTLSPAPTQSVTYYYATYRGEATDDYQGHSDTALTFSSGQTSKTISVSTVDDTEDESDERFYVYITDAASKLPNSGTPSDYLAMATGTIRDNDSSTTSALPDLIISSASLDDTTVEQGDRIRLDVTVRNQGEGEAGSSRVAYDMIVNGSLTPVESDLVRSLDANESSEEYDYISTSDLTPGNYCIGVRADYEGEVVESDETNNFYTSLDICFTVTTSALPDLIISSASLDDTTVEQGDHIRLEVTVRNQGEGEADRSRVGYYISSGSTLTLLDDDSVSSLDANESDDEYYNISTSNLTPGAHCIAVRADYEEEVVESDETNNLYTSLDLCFFVTAP